LYCNQFGGTNPSKRGVGIFGLHAAGLLENHGFRVAEAKKADAALKTLEIRRRAAAFHRHSNARLVRRAVWLVPFQSLTVRSAPTALPN
jgi:hypothetical protein